MKLINLCLVALLLSINSAYASGTEFSEPIEIVSGEGWNKVLQTSNGNTLLFHFQLRKALLVKVFDKSRKEIASEKFLGKVIEIGDMDLSELHGIYEIGNEAVVFISQPVYNNNTLIALRFNTQTGKIIKEQTLLTSPNFKARNTYSVIRNISAGGYAVFCMKDLEANFEEKLRMVVFDDSHNKLKEVPVEINTKDYDFVEHVSTDAGSDGTYTVTLTCKKIIHYPDDIDRFFAVCHLPKESNVFSIVLTKLPANVAPYFSMYTHNDFSNKLNLFVVNAQTQYYRHGLNTRSQIVYTPMLLMYQKQNIAGMSYKAINHLMANKYLKDNTDSTRSIDPIPTRVYTNRYGLTTLISEENELNVIVKNAVTSHTMIGSIAVTLIDEAGNEVWSVVLPKKQFVRTPITIYDLYQRGTLAKLFRRYDASSDWIYQFLSYNSVMNTSGTCYIIHNDLHANKNKTIAEVADSMYSISNVNRFEKTNAICYRITKKREVTKFDLFGTSSKDVSYAAMIEGSDYNEQTQTYSSVVLHRLADKYVL